MHELDRIIEESKKRASAAECFSLETHSVSVGFESNKLKRISEKESRGVGLRVIAGGKMGHIAASKLDDPALLAEKAVSLAALGEPAEFAFPGASDLPNLDMDRPSASGVTVPSMIATLEQAVERIHAYDKSVKVDAGYGTGFERVRLANTEGFDGSFTKRTVGFSVAASLIEGDNIVHLWKPGGGFEPPKDPMKPVDALIEDLKVARKTVSFPSGKFKAILTPVALADILMAFTPGINGKAVAKGTSPLKDKLGKQILDSRVNIVDDALHQDGLCSQPFDDEGLPAGRKHIVENGVLKTFVTDLKSAGRLKTRPSANASREKPLEREKTYGAPPAPEIWNLLIEPGKTSYRKMLDETEIGLEIHSISGILLGNLINGDFSGNLEMAFRVERGERVGRVKNVMISGNFYEMFRNRLIDFEDSRIWTGAFGGSSGAYLLPCAWVADLDAASGEA